MDSSPDVVPQYWTTQRRELLAWLRRNGAASLAELYEGAVELVSRAVPGRVRLVAHAVREIRNRLPGVLAPEQSERLDYKKRCEAIRKEWRPVGTSLETAVPSGTPNASGTVTITMIAADQIQRLLDDDLAVPRKTLSAATRLHAAVVRIRSGRVLSPRELAAIGPAIRAWLNVTEWFAERAHDSGVPDGETGLQEFEDRFALFEKALHSLIQEFYPATEDLDAILEEANS